VIVPFDHVPFVSQLVYRPIGRAHLASQRKSSVTFM
jgi:hypothetical protein